MWNAGTYFGQREIPKKNYIFWITWQAFLHKTATFTLSLNIKTLTSRTMYFLRLFIFLSIANHSSSSYQNCREMKRNDWIYWAHRQRHKQILNNLCKINFTPRNSSCFRVFFILWMPGDGICSKLFAFFLAGSVEKGKPVCQLSDELS